MKQWSEVRRAAYEASRVRRFWQRVDQSAGPDACWLWMGPRMWNGYGKATHEDRTQNAHRVAWLLSRGPIPSGFHVDHLCRVKQCCNPQHLEPVTVRENLHRAPTMIARVSRTHCRFGHPYSGSNLYRRGNERRCHACDARIARTYRTRRREVQS